MPDFEGDGPAFDDAPLAFEAEFDVPDFVAEVPAFKLDEPDLDRSLDRSPAPPVEPPLALGVPLRAIVPAPLAPDVDEDFVPPPFDPLADD